MTIAPGLLATAAPIPGAEKARTGLRAIAQKLAREEEEMAIRYSRIYNPPAKPPRPFEADFSNGAKADDAGRLTKDIDGRPIHPDATIVGRASLGGNDQALTLAKSNALAEATTGRLPQAVAPGSPNLGGDVGRYVITRDRRSGRVIARNIFVDRSLSNEMGPRVLFHEGAHNIDDIAGGIDHRGLDDELGRIYNDLNSRDWRFEKQERTGVPVERLLRLLAPISNLLRPCLVFELMAEAIRAYKADPNYIKTVARKTAARIRAFVNANPILSKLIHFNSLGLGVVPVTGQQEGRE